MSERRHTMKQVMELHATENQSSADADRLDVSTKLRDRRQGYSYSLKDRSSIVKNLRYL